MAWFWLQNSPGMGKTGKNKPFLKRRIPNRVNRSWESFVLHSWNSLFTQT